MIAFIKNHWILISFVAALFTFHWFSKDIRSNYERPIVGDAQAYYAYLPAIFIYQDFDYNFVQEHASQYYAPGQLKDFVKDVDGEKVNKTFPGVAVLYTPFFLLAHLSAITFGLEADGYSTIYQFWFDIGHWFYFLFGLIFLKKFLEKLNFEPKIALFTTILIGISTNLFFYTVFDQSVTHIHNFFMINGMLLSIAIWKEQKQMKWLIIALVLLALIGITRPTNILVFGLILIFFNQKSFYLDVFRSVFSKKWWKITLFVLPILLIPFVLWKIQTGHWIVYSYGEEGFDFSNPFYLDFIFSYTKGWFTYTPFALIVILIGLGLIFKTDPKKAGLMVGFYLVSIYIFSSWWCWYYGAGMSQRVMIDHYVLLAFLLATILTKIADVKWMKYAFLSLSALLIFLNVAQAWQIKQGIIQFGSATKEQYWDNFLVFEKRARVYPKEHWIKSEDELSFNEELKVNAEMPFSESLKGNIGEIKVGHKLIFSFEMLTADEIMETRGIITFKNLNNEEIPVPFYFSEFVQQDKWVYMELLFEPLEEYKSEVIIYYWNAYTTESATFKNISIKKYFSDEYY
ncbi:hypothetical protein K6119_13110 [Paracrocinitomix mangrovi]|uniref:hypothetical protein n=1 Tax=Paracrocinitomix mangrovi TaxID=2862509 RepID=UPI001C8DBAF2|nr:hypothetical protein [Paracrocinitomix mangrovi]UKN00669.1 hypothetical protein K6119_13110 [Paracrocinitomix mangrovi]